MEHINKALKDTGVTLEQLSDKTNFMIKDYKKILTGINMLEKKGHNATNGNIKAETYKKAIIEDIFEKSEELEQGKEPIVEEVVEEVVEETETPVSEEVTEPVVEPVVEKKKSSWGSTTILW